MPPMMMYSGPAGDDEDIRRSVVVASVVVVVDTSVLSIAVVVLVVELGKMTKFFFTLNVICNTHVGLRLRSGPTDRGRKRRTIAIQRAQR